MVTPNKRVTQSHRIKPLTIATPFLANESFSSWLIRAALNQGCDSLTFTQYYWSEYRLWTYDVDKGFNAIDSSIHQDMEILANTDIERFNTQNLTHFGEITHTLSKSNKVNNPWILPLSKRNRASLLGYSYCPLCLGENETAFLRLNWRFSWYSHCEHHQVRMMSTCPNCDMPYQPNLLQPKLRYINHCHFCESKLSEHYLMDVLLIDSAYSFQEKSLAVLQAGETMVFNSKVTVAEWFEYALFLINICRKAAKTADQKYMFYKFMREMDIDFESFSPDLPTLENSKTGLPFDYLSLNERIQFMSYAYLLHEKSLDEWIGVCEKVNISQNSFHFNKQKTVPGAFLPVYNLLPENSRRGYKSKATVPSPKSLESVQLAWQRLQRKMHMREKYEKQLIHSSKQ